MWEWGERRDELRAGSTIADLMEMPETDVDATLDQMTDLNWLDQAAIVRGAGFTLLRLVGHLEEPDRARLLRCLDFEIATTSDPTWLSAEVREELIPPLETQRADVQTWRNPQP